MASCSYHPDGKIELNRKKAGHTHNPSTSPRTQKPLEVQAVTIRMAWGWVSSPAQQSGSRIWLVRGSWERNIDVQVLHNVLSFLSHSETWVPFVSLFCLILLVCKEKGYIKKVYYMNMQEEIAARTCERQQLPLKQALQRLVWHLEAGRLFRGTHWFLRNRLFFFFPKYTSALWFGWLSSVLSISLPLIFWGLWLLFHYPSHCC